MKKNILYVLLFVCLLPGISFAANPPDPSEQLKPFINGIITQLKKPGFRKTPIADQTDVLVKQAAEHFDFQEMSKRVLGKPWKKLSQGKRDEFVALFTKLLQYVYIGQVDDYLDKEIKFTSQRIKGKRAEVKTLFVDGAKSIPVSYALILRADKWMVYDIAVENISLVRNYMEQIRTVLRDKEFAGLISMLQKKIQELEKEAGKESAK